MSVTFIISMDVPSTYEFACHSSACRPPKSGGTGGSSSGGGKVQVSGPFNDLNGTHKMILRRGSVVQQINALTQKQVDDFDPEAEWKKASQRPIRIRR